MIGKDSFKISVFYDRIELKIDRIFNVVKWMDSNVLLKNWHFHTNIKKNSVPTPTF